MKKLFFLCALCASVLTANATKGALPGAFTINADGDKIQFSKGNLQYVGTWQFATNQWDYFGNSQSDNHRDLFGWGTGNNPNNVSLDNNDYATYTEWGNNPITNGGNAANLWRTLTKDEWNYLFYTRENAATLFALGSVNGVNGTIFLPDDWTTPEGASFTASTTQGLADQGSYYKDENKNHFSDNIYTSEQWSVMESAGAVFLPAAGYRYGTDVGDVVSIGQYWSATPYGTGLAYELAFHSLYLYPQYSSNRYYGRSVRLVQDFVAPTYLTVEQAMETYHSLSLGSTGTKSTEAYTIRGYVTNWRSGYPQYQYADFFIDDTETGSQELLEAYQLTADNDEDKRTLIIGDYVEVTAYFKNYYGNPQLVDGTFHVITPGTAPEDKGNSSVADFISTADIKNIYHLTGTVSGLPTDKTDEAWKNGIFNLTDATGTIYIYGLLTADGVARQFSTLDIENEDEVTLKGVYSTHNGSPMIANAIFISRTKHQNQSIFNPSGQSQMGHRKFIKDGQLLIEKNGKTYNAMGAKVK